MPGETTAGGHARTDDDESHAEKTTADYAGDSLTRFQIDLLAGLATEGEVHGIGLRRAIEARYDGEVHHGRLYPNLDDLVERNLVEKGSRDGRTNEYTLTDAGRRVLDERQSWLGGGEVAATDGGDSA